MRRGDLRGRSSGRSLGWLSHCLGIETAIPDVVIVPISQEWVGESIDPPWGAALSRRARPRTRVPVVQGSGQPRRRPAQGYAAVAIPGLRPRGRAEQPSPAVIGRRPAVAVVPGLPPCGRWRGPQTGSCHIRGSPPSPRSLPPRQRVPPRRPTAPDVRARRPPPNPVVPRRRTREPQPGNRFPSSIPLEPPGVDDRVPRPFREICSKD